MSPATSPKTRGEKLLPEQRQSFILDVLAEQGVAALHQLAERLGASFSTVRRDLDELVRNGLVSRTHGGAMLRARPLGPIEEEGPPSPTGEMRAVKEAIGRMAAARIREGDSVIFDSSTTVLEAARVIVATKLRVTAVTNNLKIADLLSQSEGVRLIVPGGTRRSGTYVLSGEPGDSFLSRLHADVALIGAQSASSGVLTDSRIESASAKRLLMGAVRTRILLIDSWKFGGPGFCEVAPLTEFEEVITDSGIAEEERRDLERRGIFVQIADTRSATIPQSSREERGANGSATAEAAAIDTGSQV
ncbi:bacterial regulatory, arsR family protein [Paraburkholderia fungorum]|uniref:Bacterial regulatory, arsR family protein n=1 Tax=Paraburkholderia fungorum TaxID=134537 RepID=A0AAU8T9R2_9BURK|nr:DeoR/GlpR family DNA-binding transcription regulator [Paraburkholderia fungorum]AJZ56965.1 bacterial regulatory, arsR family protein [Paraburkholderia fungorum]